MPQTVLAIDDSLEIHQLLDVRLKPEQLSILHAIEAEEGLRMARELQPDLVLLDMNLDGRSGLEVCHLLKNNPETVNIPVIFLTGESDLSMKIRGFDAGAIDYVVKPFEPAELRARVRAALRTKRFQDLLATRAQVDALTGLRNRAYFDQRILEEMEAARRYARLASLVLVDIDHFKHVNDTFGHPVGDQVLQSVGETLASAVRTSDAVCRFGGEEFAVILREVGGAAALIVAERMRSALATCAFRQKGQLVTVTASFGVSATDCFPPWATPTVEQLVESSDAALYDAKRSGRNRICMTTSLPIAFPTC